MEDETSMQKEDSLDLINANVAFQMKYVPNSRLTRRKVD